MNAVVRAHLAGLGEDGLYLGANPLPPLSLPPLRSPSLSSGGGSSGGGFHWGNIIAPLENFGTQFLQQWGNRQAYRAGINPNQQSGGGGGQYMTQPPAGSNNLTAEQLAAIAAAKSKSDELASGSITGKGVKIGDTVVTWPTIGIAVAGFMLLQSQGFQKRR